MTVTTKSLYWLLPLVAVLIAGCAPAYHSYSGCNVNCKYCAPPPLPYTHSVGCVCHSCAASEYLSAQPQFLNGRGDGTETDIRTE
jgi:hypothetical protein